MLYICVQPACDELIAHLEKEARRGENDTYQFTNTNRAGSVFARWIIQDWLEKHLIELITKRIIQTEDLSEYRTCFPTDKIQSIEQSIKERFTHYFQTQNTVDVEGFSRFRLRDLREQFYTLFEYALELFQETKGKYNYEMSMKHWFKEQPYLYDEMKIEIDQNRHIFLKTGGKIVWEKAYDPQTSERREDEVIIHLLHAKPKQLIVEDPCAYLGKETVIMLYQLFESGVCFT